MDDDMIILIIFKLIGNKLNIYIYIKYLVEYLLVKEGSDFFLVIVRFFIVGVVWKEFVFVCILVF